MKDLSMRFKKIMNERGLKAADLANLMGYSPQYISDLFGGKRRWNETTINKACSVLNVKLDLINESENDF